MANRGKSLSPTDKLKLIALAAGRCEFEGCGVNLFKNDDTNENLNWSQIAHIIASSPDGPRGKPNSHEISDCLENNILLCPKHHKLIDSNPADFPPEKLLAMKHNHEYQVGECLQGLGAQETYTYIITSKIGDKTVVINEENVLKSTFPEFKTIGRPIIINVFVSNEEYNTSQYWKKAFENLENQLNITLASTHNSGKNISIFTIAPIPILIKLGKILGDKSNIEIFPHFRDNTWRWSSESNKIDFKISSQLSNTQETFIALVLEVSGTISNDRLNCNNKSPKFIVRVSPTEAIPTIDLIKSKDDLIKLKQQFISALDQCINFDKNLPIYIFAAIPCPVAVELGRCILEAHKNIYILNAPFDTQKNQPILI